MTHSTPSLAPQSSSASAPTPLCRPKWLRGRLSSERVSVLSAATLLAVSLLSCRRPEILGSGSEAPESVRTNQAASGDESPASTTLPGKPQQLTKDYACNVIVDGSDVFYAKDGLKQVPLAGGTPRTVAKGSGYTYGVDEQFVYYSNRDGNGVLKVPRAGGESMPVAKVEGTVASLAVDRSHVYFGAAYSGLHRVSKEGGEAERIGNVFESTPLLIDDRYVYYYGSETDSDGLWKLPKTGGEAIQLVDIAAVRERATAANSSDWIRMVGDLAQDEKYIYGRTADCGVYRVSKNGGAPEFIVHAKCDVGTHVAVGESILLSSDEQLLEAPLEGGKPRVLLDQVDVVCSIATGPGYVVAGTGGIGLVRLDRP